MHLGWLKLSKSKLNDEYVNDLVTVNSSMFKQFTTVDKYFRD